MKALLVWLSAGAVLAGVSVAAPPPEMLVNPGVAAWFRSLRQPGTDLPCCSIADCRRVNYRIAPAGTYEVYIDDFWYPVPETIVIHRNANPIEAAVVCFQVRFGYATLPGINEKDRADALELLCFVPAAVTS